MYVLQVEIVGEPKASYFRFTGVEAEIKANAIMARLEASTDETRVTTNSIEYSSLQKIAQLNDSKQLHDLFEDLVIQKRQLSETEFWNSYSEKGN